MTTPILLTALKTITLLIGATITFFSYRAYRRTGVPALRALTIGFGIVTLGSLLAGVADQFVNLGRDSAIVVESALTAVGFAVILYSLYVE
jgi:O-antigen/teichoic acid export membrane protein